MKKTLFSILLAACLQTGFSQAVLNYKVKNAANEKDRTMMLDIYRASLYQEYKQEFIFVVNHFKVSQNYAWLMADVQRKDGKQVKMPDPDGYDCCHVEALFKKTDGKWYLVESGAFSTDVWFMNIRDKNRNVPRSIFPPNYVN